MIPSRKPSPVQRSVTALFFSIFLLAGCAFTYGLLIRPLALNLAARHWLTVPCRVISSEVRSHSGKGTTYSVEITYAYFVDGKEYRSNRYRFLRSSSSGYQGKAVVVARYAPGRQAVCYVNPKQPSEAVLNREITAEAWLGLFPLVFVGMGAAGILSVLRGGGKTAAGGFDANPSSGGPWMQRPDWATGRIVSSTKGAMRGIWFFAVIWNLISMPVAWTVLSENTIQKGNYGPAVVLIFPLIGLGLLFWAVTLARRWQRFGESVFEMAGVPGGIGGVLEGTIRSGRPFRSQGPVKLRLNCLERTTSNSGENTSTNDRILWQHEEAVEMDGTDGIPVAFYIPGDCNETNTLGAGDGTHWRLDVSAHVLGGDYVASFEVPVFQVEQTPAQRAEAAKLQSREQAEVAAYVPSPVSRIRVQELLRGGKEFYFPACRNPGPALFALVFLLIWSGILWFMIHKNAPILFPIVFGFFDLVLIIAVAHAWTGTTRVVVDRESVTVEKAVLGIRRSKTIAPGEIASIKTKTGMTCGTTVYRDIKINLRDDGEVGAGSSIKDELEAEWLAAEMTKALAGK